MQNARQVSLNLDEIAALLDFAGESKFKIKAYQRAAQVVNTLGNELGTFVEQGRLRELPGIGAALSRQIEELWNSGTSDLLARLRRELPEGAAELVQVEGLTPKRIRALSESLGVRSVQELREACATGRVRELRGFGEKTEARLLRACEKWLARDQEKLRPLIFAKALELAALIRKRLMEVAEDALVAGDLRRGEELIDNLDFVVVGDPKRALERLSSLRQVLRVDVGKRIAYLTDGLTLRIHTANESNLGNALFFATGNSAHVESVRARASERELNLAGEGANPSTNAVSFASEEALYQSLGLSFVPPELRVGKTEVDEATREDFSDLIGDGDIQGMVHCHTNYSDGKNTVMEMALAAHALGMKYITITDHSQSAHYAGGVTVDRLKQQWDEIAAAQDQVPVRILRGTESDILADGSLDYPDAIIEQFDVVIASIHARHRMDSATMTNRITRALSFPIFKIWGHALGRILNHRDPIASDAPLNRHVVCTSKRAVDENAYACRRCPCIADACLEHGSFRRAREYPDEGRGPRPRDQQT